MRFGSITPVFNEQDLIGPFLDLMDVEVKVVIISDQTFQGNQLEHDDSEKIAIEKGAIVIRTTTKDQIAMRNLGLALLQGMGINYAFIADVDEWYPKQTLENYKKAIEETQGDAYISKMQVLFRKPTWAVSSPHDGGSCIALKTDKRLKLIRSYEGDNVMLPPEFGMIYHFSYARKPEKIKEKITNFSHASEVLPDWYEQVFLPCTAQSRNVHPTVPEAWPDIKEIELPEEIKSKWSLL